MPEPSPGQGQGGPSSPEVRGTVHRVTVAGVCASYSGTGFAAETA